VLRCGAIFAHEPDSTIEHSRLLCSKLYFNQPTNKLVFARESLDTTRQRLAAHYLVDTAVSVTEIAFLLGYSESSTFDRAFRRWTQMTPGEYHDSH